VLPSKNNFLDHVKWLRSAVRAQGAELLVAGDSMAALVRQGQRHWVLHPQFLAPVAGVNQYVPTLTDDATHFAGWLPYRNRRWPAATDKLLFKRVAHQAGLRVPEFALETGPEMHDVVVKRAASSFGEQVRGPFRSSAECPLDVTRGDYYERFIAGELLKAWYWNGTAVAVEVDAMPAVVGDGRATLRELITQRATLMRAQSDEALQRLLGRSAVLLAYHGRALDEVLPAGVRQRVEFRYGSDLMHPRGRRVVDLRAVDPGSEAGLAWAALMAAGAVLQGAVPEDLRAQTLFTLDAVRDKDQRIWFLEMNSNPTVHPLAYPRMIADLIGAAQGQGQGHEEAPGPSRRPVPAV